MINKRSFFQNIIFVLTLGMVLLFCVFPFIQILSTSLKYQPDWGNPSLVPQRINLEAYKDILGFMDRKVQIPDQIGRLLDNSILT